MKPASLLVLRNSMKKKKPVFLKQDAHKMGRLQDNWRQPRGRHSKMRLKLRGYRVHPSIGYSSPKSVRGLTPEGHQVVIVHTPSQLDHINQPITIGADVGMRKKLEIAKKALEKKIDILNIEDVQAFVKRIEEMLQKRRDAKKKKISQKEKTKEERLKKAEQKQKEEEQKTKEEKLEEQTKEEKEEKRKVLEQR